MAGALIGPFFFINFISYHCLYYLVKGTVVVTGGSGFLGQRISARLREHGYRVYQMAMPGEDFTGMDVFEGDISSKDGFQFPKCDIVVHCAGILESSHPSDELMFKVNLDGTINVYEQGRRSEMKKFIMISTISAIGPMGKKNSPITERTEQSPVDAYGRSKKEAEEYLVSESEKDDIDLIILRPTVLYGEGMNLNSSGMKTFTSIKKGIMPMVGKGNTVFNLLYIDNFVESILLSCINGNGIRSYNVSEGPYKLSYVIERIESELGKKGHMKIPKAFLWLLTGLSEITSHIKKGPPILSWTKYHALTSDIWHTSSDLIRDELGWDPEVSLEDGISRTVDHYGLRER